MMKKLRGRNLKHPGCLIGVTLGTIIGIVLAGVLASVYNVAMTIDVWVWFGLIFVLGAVGWVIGDRLSSRFPALEEDTPETTQSDLSQSS
jgi:MFS family permease